MLPHVFKCILLTEVLLKALVHIRHATLQADAQRCWLAPRGNGRQEFLQGRVRFRRPVQQEMDPASGIPIFLRGEFREFALGFKFGERCDLTIQQSAQPILPRSLFRS